MPLSVNIATRLAPVARMMAVMLSIAFSPPYTACGILRLYFVSMSASSLTDQRVCAAVGLYSPTRSRFSPRMSCSLKRTYLTPLRVWEA